MLEQLAWRFGVCRMLQINLLPWRKERRLKHQQKIKQLAYFFVCLVVVSLGAMYFLQNKKTYPKKRVMVQPIIIPRPSKIISQSSLSNTHSFFISDEKIMQRDALQAISWRQFKWVGYLANQKLTTVFLKNPTGETIAVKAGDNIGSEHATLIAVKDKQLLLALNHKIIKMPRNNSDDVSI